jgi:protoporphyrinogen oxidase
MTKALAATDIGQKTVETSLIERFLYPKLGPGQMWEYVAKDVQEMGGEILMNLNVVNVKVKDNKVESIDVRDSQTGEIKTFHGDYYFSTMAIKDLIRAMAPPPPAKVREISEGLTYRDFVTVGLLVKKLKLKPDASDRDRKLISDNWIYIQEPDVKLGRLQIFNNWSPYLVADPTKVWMGLEYFCDEGDAIWNKTETEMVAFASKELEQIGIIDAKDVVDSTVIKVEKTYPGYFGTYDRFDELRAYLDTIENLFLVGRNGMHKYNNQDHSMLTAMTAVENISQGIKSKDNLWAINLEADYHEEKSAKT